VVLRGRHLIERHRRRRHDHLRHVLVAGAAPAEEGSVVGQDAARVPIPALHALEVGARGHVQLLVVVEAPAGGEVGGGVDGAGVVPPGAHVGVLDVWRDRALAPRVHAPAPDQTVGAQTAGFLDGGAQIDEGRVDLRHHGLVARVVPPAQGHSDGVTAAGAPDVVGDDDPEGQHRHRRLKDLRHDPLTRIPATRNERERVTHSAPR
jgi:hypothetical protein